MLPHQELVEIKGELFEKADYADDARKSYVLSLLAQDMNKDFGTTIRIGDLKLMGLSMQSHSLKRSLDRIGSSITEGTFRGVAESLQAVLAKNDLGYELLFNTRCGNDCVIWDTSNNIQYLLRVTEDIIYLKTVMNKKRGLFFVSKNDTCVLFDGDAATTLASDEAPFALKIEN